MKPKIKLLFFSFLCLLSSNFIIAQPVSISTAIAIAENHLSAISKPSLKSTSIHGNNIHFTSVKAAVENSDTLYYILNDTINKGFVIVSADKRAWPILGYSTTGSFDEENQPEAFTAWMENRKKEIEYLKKNNIEANSAIKEKWQDFNLKSTAIETKSVEPLIKTQWDQGCYYNTMCPADPTSRYCRHVPVGCTVTAMAQIMKYWNYPTKGVGSHTYYDPPYGELSADFDSTTYQWSQMPNSVTSQNDAVATLMYHCGVSLEMDYGPGGSKALSPIDGLVKYFNYSSNARMITKNGYTTNEWINLLKSELDLKRPIWFSEIFSAGHSFICDGYQDEDYFHFNWGWSGRYDGYFYIGNLNPMGADMNEFQLAVINICPKTLPDSYNGFFLSANVVDIATKGGITSVDVCSSVNWTASSDQTWISLSAKTGVSGKTTLTFTVTENKTGSDRSATVTISAAGFDSQKITVDQFCELNIEPGGLYEALANKAYRITHLTIADTIDARDFKTMRDVMPALTHIDLSEATIVEYSGTNGPSELYKKYPANAIPSESFCFTSFQSENLIESIILPKSLNEIENFAFRRCKNLVNIYIPSSVTKIDNSAFDESYALINVDPNNQKYSSIDGVLFNKDQTLLIHCPIFYEGNYIIPNTVTDVLGEAFRGCDSLASIFIPASVTQMHEASIYGTFSYIFIVDSNNLNYSSIDGVLFNKEKSRLIKCPPSKNGNYTIPSSVKTIGTEAFLNCSRLTNIEIPSSVNTIKTNAFLNCCGLTNIEIPSSVNTIEIVAFGNCYNLTSLTIPLSVTTIPNQICFGCTRLTTLTIQGSITDIGASSFDDCLNLTSFQINTISPAKINLSSSAFNNLNLFKCTLFVPYGAKAAYQSTAPWSYFGNIVEMPGLFISKRNIEMLPSGEAVQIDIYSSINYSITSDQTWLSINPTSKVTGCDTIVFTASANNYISARNATVTITADGLDPQTITVKQLGQIEVTPGNLKSILAEQISTITNLTFHGTIDARDFKTMRDEMPELMYVDLSDTKIVEYKGCDGTYGKNNITYPADEVPAGAFNNFESKLKSIILPSSTTTIGINAFRSCFNLKSIIIPPLVTTIDSYAFWNCTKLSEIFIPISVTTIGTDALSRKSLITVDSNNPNYSSIDGVLFNKNQTILIQYPSYKYGEYTIPSSVQTIASFAFKDCVGLTNIEIPSSVTSIEYYSFCSCTNLSHVTIPSKVTTIENTSFKDCIDLASVILPSSITSIKNFAFANCYVLDSICVYAQLPPTIFGTYAFSEVDKASCTLYVPYGTKDAYQEANQWKDFKNIVEMPNQAPIANASTDQIAKAGKLVTLDGIGSSDPEGILLTYKWTAPTGITLNATTVANPTFTAPKVDTITNFTFSLIVNDGILDSPADEVVVTVIPNNAPIANAGTDQSVNENSLCILNGSASSDDDHDKLTYLWTAPEGITLSSNSDSKPTFTTPEVTTDTNYTFSLVVNDGTVNSTADQVVVIVKNVNKVPAANAGVDQTVDENAIVILDGSASSDADDDKLTYLWTAPEGITLSSNSDSKPTFTAPEVTVDTNYTFSLIVNDGTVNSTAVLVVVTVKNTNITGTQKKNDLNKLQVYPNPTTGSVEITMTGLLDQNYSIEVYNGIGQLKLTVENISKVDLSSLTNGIYLIKVNTQNQSYLQKIIKK